MPQDGTVQAATPPHPSWCDPSECTTAHDHPYGAHQSAARVIAAETPSGTVIETHLTSLFKGVIPSPLLVVEFTDSEGSPTPYLLTMPQARRLRDAITHLLTIAAPDRAGTRPLATTSTAPPT